MFWPILTIFIFQSSKKNHFTFITKVYFTIYQYHAFSMHLFYKCIFLLNGLAFPCKYLFGISHLKKLIEKIEELLLEV